MVAVRENIEKKRVINLNKSLYFLLPMLRITYDAFKDTILNSYIGDKLNRKNINNYHIFILAREEDERLTALSTFKEVYKVDEGYMHVFRIPEKYELDYLKFILGQYSQFSAEYKQELLKRMAVPYQQSVVFKVITKSPEAKKIIEDLVGESIGNQEVMSIPDYNSEVYG